MNLTRLVVDARKAVATLGSFEATAVTLGVLDNAQAATVTAVLGVVSSVLVYLVPNGKQRQPVVVNVHNTVPPATPTT